MGWLRSLVATSSRLLGRLKLELKVGSGTAVQTARVQLISLAGLVARTGIVDVGMELPGYAQLQLRMSLDWALSRLVVSHGPGFKNSPPRSRPEPAATILTHTRAAT